MPPKAINIAILSPSKDAYSETFIQAHRKKLNGAIFFYYGIKSSKILKGEGDLKKNWKKLFFKIQRKNLRKSYSWYYDRFLFESFKKKKIDVVLAEYGTTAQAHIDIIKELDIPLIVHFHGFDAYKKEVIQEHNNYKEVFQTAKFVVAVSHHMCNELIRLGCPPNKLIYNVYGPDDAFFNVVPSFSSNQFIAIGRLVDKKAPYYLILAFRKVVKEFPDAKLIIAGNGTLLSVCKNLARHCGMEENINFPGIITPQQYMSYLRTSIAMVQHSITAESGDSEGTPLTVLEASAAGLPVISTIHAGIPDVIIDGKTGLLTNEHDVEGMADNMLKILKNPLLARDLGASGKQHMQKNFTLQRHLELLDDLLEKAVKDH